MFLWPLPAPFRAPHHYQPASPPSQATTAAANSNKAPTDLPNIVFVRYTRKTPTHPSAGKKNHLPNPTQVLKYLQTRQKATYERRAHPANVPINTMNVSGRSLDNRDPLEENFPHNQLGIEQHSLTHNTCARRTPCGLVAAMNERMFMLVLRNRGFPRTSFCSAVCTRGVD